MSQPKQLQLHRPTEFAHNGERSRVESAWSWECCCGDCESAHLKSDARFEWNMHLDYRAENLVDQLHGNIEVHKGRVLGRDEVKAYIKRLLTGRASLPGYDVVETPQSFDAS